MAISIAGGGAAHTMWHGNPGPITSLAIDSTGANQLILSDACDIGSGVVSISDSYGNTWSLKSSNDSGHSRLQIWEAATPVIVGSGHTFTVTNALFCRAQITAFTGYGGLPTLDQGPSRGTGSSSAQPGSITPTVDGELLICCSASDNSIGGIASIDSGFSIIDQGPEVSSDCYGLAVAYLAQTAAAAENPTYSWTTASACSATIISYKDPFGSLDFLLGRDFVPTRQKPSSALTIALKSNDFVAALGTAAKKCNPFFSVN